MRQTSQLWNHIDSYAVIVGDAVASGLSFLLMCLLAISIGGCTEIGQLSAQDAQRAAAIATAVGDPGGIACWRVLEAAGKAISAAGDKLGPFVGIEEKRAVQMALTNPACLPVLSGAFVEGLTAIPAPPLMP